LLLLVGGLKDEAVQRHAGAEHLHDIVFEFVAEQDVVRHFVHGAVVVVFQEVDVFPVVGIALGGTAQNLGGEIAVAEILLVLLVVANGEELVGVVEYLLPYCRQLVLVGHEDAAAQAAVAVQSIVLETNLEVVAGLAAALDAVATEEEGYVRLVGPFVLREAQVAVDAVEAFLGIGVTDRGVERTEFVDDMCGEVYKFFADGIVAALVVHKPLAVVVDCQFFKKMYCVRRHVIEYGRI